MREYQIKKNFSPNPKSAEFMATWKLNFASKHPKVWWDLTGSLQLFKTYLAHFMSQITWIFIINQRWPCQILSYFWVFWGKIQLSSGHKVSWFRVRQKKFPENSLPHMELSSMPFWSKYKDSLLSWNVVLISWKC